MYQQRRPKSKRNQHFATIGAKLGAKFNINLLWNLTKRIHQFQFKMLMLSLLKKKLCSLCSKHLNLDVLGFDSYLLRVGSKYLASSLSHVINLSESGEIPQRMENSSCLSKNKGSTQELCNYRQSNLCHSTCS